jgi:hypothetical protein
MQSMWSRGLGLALFLAFAAAVQAAPDERQAFMEQQKAARSDFRQRQDRDGKAFRESIKDKTSEERKALIAQFHAKQKAERAAFNKDQQEERSAFREAHPSRHHRRKRAEAPRSE